MTVFSACVLTLYPELFPGPLGASLAGKALDTDLWDLSIVNIRDYARDRHGTVDDTPAGGGPGMVMKADVLARAIDDLPAAHRQAPRILLSPRGRTLRQSDVEAWAMAPQLTLICGRFEGVDQRVIDGRGLIECSIGDYVLSGGEVAAMVVLDAIVRLLPGVMGNAQSAVAESFTDGLLEYPHYTRPAEWEGRAIPEVLLSGDHGRIAEWRADQARRVTRENRPDLWQAYSERSAARTGGGKTGSGST